MVSRLLTLAVLCLTIPFVAMPPVPAANARADAPTHEVSVTGDGVSTWPDFSPDVERYAVQTDGDTGGALSVHVTTSDPAGTVTIDGRPVANDVDTVVSGLVSGDEVSVAITDGGGTSHQAWIYLPAGFPTLTATAPAEGLAPGFVFLGLQSFLGLGRFETVVDTQGVPVEVADTLGNDMKPSDAEPDHYSVARADVNGYRIDELDSRFEVVHSFRLAGALAGATDFHDVQLLPGGRALLIGYDYSTHHGGDWVDAVIQIVDGDGQAEFTWNSKDQVDPSQAYVAPALPNGYRDYAHINSVQLLPDGDVLASFRNLSQIMRIATTSHDGFAPGDVVWTLGGATNDFALDDPLGGPCAQHMARLLDDGRLRIFDNGSRDDGPTALGGQTADMCPDPTNPDGPRVARPQSRVATYELDLTTSPPTATIVSDYQVPGRYAAFAGSQQVLDNGDLFVGWSLSVDTLGSQGPQPMATEVNPDGNEIWSIRAPGYFSYRAVKYDAPDAIPPVVDLVGPLDGDVYVQGDVVVADYGCTDRGGSTLQECTGTVATGQPVDTAVGSHELTVQATDGAGNTTTSIVHYRVRPTFQPDAAVRVRGGTWIGTGLVGGARQQRIVINVWHPGERRRALARITNDGLQADRFVVTGTPGNARYIFQYRYEGNDVTRRVVSGRLRTPSLLPGESYTLTLVLKRTAKAADGSDRTAIVRAVSTHDGLRHDAVGAQIVGR